jgi:hypothetical protein
MRRFLSKIVVIHVCLCILSCTKGSNHKDSSNLNDVTILKTNETFLMQNNVGDFISKNSFPILKSALDDDREL